MSSAALEGRVVAVTFSPPGDIERFRTGLGLTVPVYADPDRVAYRALGFGRASRARVWLDPRVWRRYAQLLARGRRPVRSTGDTLQLGGDAVLDATGRLSWVYRSRGPEDRPSVEAVAEALARAT